MTQTLEQYHDSLLAQLDTRATLEASDNHSMKATIKSLRNDVSHSSIAATLQASNFDVSLVTARERSNKMRNVYSLAKSFNVARAINKVAQLNHYTRAIFAFAASCEKILDSRMTHADAVSLCSNECKHSDKKRESLIAKHRYDRAIAANTASTQSSSSINALQSVNVLIESRDSANRACYSIDRDAFASKAIAKLLNVKL